MGSSDKKRKRAAVPSTDLEEIVVSHASATEFPPIVATSRGIEIPKQVYTPYTSTNSREHLSHKKRSRAEYLLHTSNSRLDYEGRESAEDNALEKHYIGIYDPNTQTVELHPAPKIQIRSTIKENRLRDAQVQERGARYTYDEARTVLGKAFGTRKAQLALENREINKVDVTGMDREVGSAVVSTVAENTKNIPSTDMLNQTYNEVRPLPNYNADAEHPRDIYKRVDLISDEDWNTIWTSDWITAGNVTTNSLYVNSRANKLLEDGGKKHIGKLKMLRYIGWLLDLYVQQQKSRGRLPPIAKAKNYLYGAAQQVVEGFYKRFSEDIAGPARQNEDGSMSESMRHTVSPKLETKLVYNIAILSLMIGDFDVDIHDLRIDMNIQPRELSNAFREVGCTVKELTKTQYTSMKMTKADAAQHKKAILKTPLEFPPPPKRRTRR